MRRETLICVALSAIVLTGFWPVGHLGFILFDDHNYITENPNIQAGITVESVGWAFTSTYSSNWHPVTWLSHMLDCKLFGLNASGHHWMNLGFHIANTLLLFIVLRQMTHAVWRSALVAALFALHPLHVQSVAWVSERKDLLSGFFAMLTLWAYVRFVQKSEVGSRKSEVETSAFLPAFRPPPLPVITGLALVFFALGLMSKPMLVTLPLILLLLDFWPLGRIPDFGFRISDLKSILQPRKWAWPRGAALRGFTPASFKHLLFEKLPFAVLSLVSCIVTFQAQNTAESVVSLDLIPWYLRLENVLVSYAAYLGKFFWPVNLAVFYPYPQIPLWKVFGSGLLLIGLSVFCLRRMRFQPWLFAGWLWFLVMLLPVIGLVQVGMQSMADRYTYLPSIGLFIMAAWGMAGIAAISRRWRTGMAAGAAGLVLACLLETRLQLGYWRDSVTLYSRAVEVTRENNDIGYYLLGTAYGESGNLDEAVRNFQTALRITPKYENAHYQLAHILFLQKKFEAAEAQFDEILRLNPSHADAHKHLGDTLAAQGKYAEAEAEYSNALQLRPDDATTRKALAVVTLKAESENNLSNLYGALKVLPTPETHAQIAAIRTTQGQFQDAAGHYIEALRLSPDSPDVLNNLAWLLTTCPDARVRDGIQAVKYARHACELTHYGVAPIVGTLAAAYAEAGQFDDAISTAEKACALASESGDPDLLKKNQELLALYRAHKPYHEAP